MASWNNSIWNGASPPDGPAIVGWITLGVWFELDAAGVVTGVRWYQSASSHGLVAAAIWAEDGTTILGTAMPPPALANRDDAGAAWRTAWVHPRVYLPSTTPALLSVLADLGGGVWRDDNGLAGGDVGAMGVRALSIAPDAASGGRYVLPPDSISNPPTNPTSNLYGIDVLVDFP